MNLMRTCAVRLTRYYGAAPEDVWAALTEPESLARWLAAPVEIELRSGGAFRLQLAEGETMNGRVRSIDPPRNLEIDWRRSGEEPSIIRFELSSDGERTVLVLEHRRIEAKIGMRYAAIWERRLHELDSVVEQ
jgi:uncharacterized protein YndB with AHSA1/START domain